jgi:hypothetical protein
MWREIFFKSGDKSIQKLAVSVLSGLICIGSWSKIQNALVFNPLENIFSDPARHFSLAQKALSTDPFSVIDPIGYQVWLGIVLKITSTDKLAVGLYAGILSVFTFFFWFLALSKMLSNRWLILVAGVIFAWMPSWTGIFSYFMNETLLLPLLGLSLYLTFKEIKHPDSVNWWLLCAVWVIASLTRLIALPLAMVAIGCLVIKKPNLRNFSWVKQVQTYVDFKKIAVFGIVLVVFSIPLGYRSSLVLNTFAPFGHQGMNQIYYNSGKKIVKMELTKNETVLGAWEFGSPSVFNSTLEPLSDWKSQREGEVNIKINLDNGQQDWDETLKNQPFDMKLKLQNWFENSVFLFLGASWPDNNPKRSVEYWSLQTRWVWLPLFLVVLAGNLIYFLKQKRLSLVSLLFLVGWSVAIFLPVAIAEGRYRKPLEGLTLLNLFWLIDIRLKALSTVTHIR